MITRLDVLLFLMVIIWGANFSVVKVAMRDFPELAFNAMRLMIGSLMFGTAIWWKQRTTGTLGPRLTRADWIQLALLGVVGHFVYQLLFLGGIKRTSVANGSLIVGTSPVAIALLASIVGHERVTPLRWIGVLLSLGGLYLVVGHRAEWSAESRVGDAMVAGSMLCWSVYSVAAQPLLRVHSPLIVTGISMTVGALIYVAFSFPVLAALDWPSISALSWSLMVGSAVLALGVSYLIWYTAVQRLGSTRTSAYSYLTPVIAMIVAAVWLHEPISGNQAAGTCAIVAGLLITRMFPAG